LEVLNEIIRYLGTAIVAVFVIGLAGLALWLNYRFRATGKLRSKLARGIATARRPFKSIEAERQKRERKLDRSVRDFVGAQQKERQRAVPADDLKEHGAERVRWAALKEAGYRNLADLAGVSARRLAAVKGIGDTTAARIWAAARDALEAVQSEPPRLPDADLEAPRAPEAAGAAFRLIAFSDELGEDYPRIWKSLAELEVEWLELSRELAFGRWLVSPFARSRAEASEARGLELAQAVGGVILNESFTELGSRLKLARKTRGPKKGSLPKLATERYAELCSVLEQAFVRLGLAVPEEGLGIRGGLPAKIAERVEAFELNVRDLRLTLRGYQAFGAKYLLEQKRTILGDEMGLGKTIEALAVMAHLWADREGARFFVVAPAGLLWNWQREVEKFAPFPAYVIHGDDAEQLLASWRSSGGTAITSYATLRNLDLDALIAGDDELIDFMIADEAHYLKNPKALRSIAARRLVETSKRLALMSGTPLENHPGEFVHLIRMVQPDVVANLEREGVSAESRAEAHSFHRLVAGVYLRRNQRDVLSELPERIEVEEWVDLDGEGEHVSYAERVFASDFMGMRRATTLMGEALAPSKAERLEELFDDHRESGRKVIVFSFFLDVLKAVESQFKAVGTIDGSVSPKDRMKLVDKFTKSEGHAVLAIQIDAGGTGLNLQAASAVVLMEPQLKPTTEAQAIARAHRMGQTNRVIVHRMLARGTIDERLSNMLAAKSELFDAYARESATTDASQQAREAGAVKDLIQEEREALSV